MKKESILPQLNFEDRGYLLSLYESINKSSSDFLMTTTSPFINMLSAIKIKSKTEKHPSNGLLKEDVSFTVKVHLIFSELSLFQQKFQHNSEVESNFLTDSSLLINDIYKLLSIKERNFNENNINNNASNKKSELDVVVEYIFVKYIDDINNYFDFVNLVENQSKKSNKDVVNNNALSYEQFQKYFKIVIKFYIFTKGFENIYAICAKNDKIMTADLISCINKILKNLNESNLFYIVGKKIIDMVDTNQITIDKNDYYSICVRALS